jgi:hypothetical protein
VNPSDAPGASPASPGQHPRARLIIIAPTRAACETIELAFGLRLDTVLEREHGERLRDWARRGIGFGIVAGTGVGKTLGVRPIAEEILQVPLRVGVVNREREATPETPFQNVIVVTTGIARRWFQDDMITARDTLVVDEIHQTSAELELCLALGKRAGCRFIWLSATVDPTFYSQYLNSAEVLVTKAFDPALRAKVQVVPQRPGEFLNEHYIRRVIKMGRGVAVFVPTRKEVEQLAEEVGATWPTLTTAFYHGGEPVRVIRPFLEGEVERPFLLAMTAAGQSALNVRGLDTVIIYDARYANKVERGRNVLHRLHLGPNEILQMAGRVHGRVANGEVVILSDRELDFAALKPGPPEFQLAGDAERVALTCAAMGVDARDLDLPVPLDRTAYAAAVDGLLRRGLIENGRLTAYGRKVEALPVDRPWGELLVHADDELLPLIAVAAGIESLHRMTRDERDLHGVQVAGSDHLTAYNLYAEAVNQVGGMGEVFGLPRHVFEEVPLAEWAEKRGVLVKAIEDAALGTASVYRALDRPLPRTLPYASKELRGRFAELLAQFMPFDLVIDEKTADGQEVRVSKTSVAGTWGPVAGTVRWFADRTGTARAAIEGTTLAYDLVKQYATWGTPRIEVGGPRKQQRLSVHRPLQYFGFELETGIERLDDRFPDDLADLAREALTTALLRGETTHPAQGAIRRVEREADELWRRSGGRVAALAPEARRAVLRRQLDGVWSWDEFLVVRLRFDLDAMAPPKVRAALEALPASVRLRGDACPVSYELLGETPIARVRLREGQARRLSPNEFPSLDRPLYVAIMQGEGEDVLGATVDEALTALHRQRKAQSRYADGRRPERGGDDRDGRERGRGGPRRGGPGGPKGRGGRRR